MSSNRRLLGVCLVLMSGSLAVAADFNATTVVQDTYVTEGVPGQAAGDWDVVITGGTPGFAWEEQAYIQFDLPHASDGLYVESATLQLFLRDLEWANRTDTSFGVRAVTSTWNEFWTTWNTRPTVGDALYDPQLVLGLDIEPEPQVVTNPNVWMSWDVTEITRAWHDGSLENHGFAIVWAGGDEDYSMFLRLLSSNTGDEAFFPKLDVVFGEGGLLGDMNVNGLVDFDDIAPFNLGLTNEAAYETAYGQLPVVNGDTDANGIFDFDDIAGFVALLGGGQAVGVVPEPSSALLAALGLVGLAATRMRRRIR